MWQEKTNNPPPKKTKQNTHTTQQVLSRKQVLNWSEVLLLQLPLHDDSRLIKSGSSEPKCCLSPACWASPCHPDSDKYLQFTEPVLSKTLTSCSIICPEYFIMLSCGPEQRLEPVIQEIKFSFKEKNWQTTLQFHQAVSAKETKAEKNDGYLALI